MEQTKNCCCYNCGKRTAGCHGKCSDYLAYKEQKNKENEEKKKERFMASLLPTRAILYTSYGR